MHACVNLCMVLDIMFPCVCCVAYDIIQMFEGDWLNDTKCNGHGRDVYNTGDII